MSSQPQASATPLLPPVAADSTASTSDLQRSPTPRKLTKRHSDQSSLKDFVITTSKSEKEVLDQEVANYIFATNTPFHAVEHPQFIKMINKLRPGYTPPNRKQFGGSLLEEAFSNALEQYSED